MIAHAITIAHLEIRSLVALSALMAKCILMIFDRLSIYPPCSLRARVRRVRHSNGNSRAIACDD